MGRPKGSKNKKTVVKKLVRSISLKEVVSSGLSRQVKQDYSFDLDAIVCLDTALWNIRKEVERFAVERAGDNRKCIPRKIMVEAFSSLGLKKFTIEVERDLGI